MIRSSAGSPVSDVTTEETFRAATPAACRPGLIVAAAAFAAAFSPFNQ